MALFEKLAAKATKAAMDKAFAKGLLRCTNCGKKPSMSPADAETLIRCEACGMDSLPSEWRADPTGVPPVSPDQMPEGITFCFVTAVLISVPMIVGAFRSVRRGAARS
jgi:hypothetical protein